MKVPRKEREFKCGTHVMIKYKGVIYAAYIHRKVTTEVTLFSDGTVRKVSRYDMRSHSIGDFTNVPAKYIFTRNKGVLREIDKRHLSKKGSVK